MKVKAQISWTSICIERYKGMLGTLYYYGVWLFQCVLDSVSMDWLWNWKTHVTVCSNCIIYILQVMFALVCQDLFPYCLKYIEYPNDAIWFRCDCLAENVFFFCKCLCVYLICTVYLGDLMLCYFPLFSGLFFLTDSGVWGLGLTYLKPMH